MFSKYKPTWMIDVIYRATPAQLKKLRVKAVLISLGNTLIAWNNPDGIKELKTWLLEMRNIRITVFVVSNNKDGRTKCVVEEFDLDYVVRALKPTARGFKLAEKKLGLKPPRMLMVDNQIMMDTREASATGIRDILVQPIVSTGGWDTRINRFFRREVMKHLSKKHPEMTWKSGSG